MLAFVARLETRDESTAADNGRARETRAGLPIIPRGDSSIGPHLIAIADEIAHPRCRKAFSKLHNFCIAAERITRGDESRRVFLTRAKFVEGRKKYPCTSEKERKNEIKRNQINRRSCT